MSFDGRRATTENIADPASAVEQAVAATPFTYGLARAFVSDIATVIDFVDGAGNVITGFPCASGYNPVKASQINNLGGATIFGLF